MTAAGPVRGGFSLRALARACRPRHWVKSGLVFVPLISSVSFRSADAVWRAAEAAVAFSILASAVYLLNDIADRESDRAHPLKRLRPVASGALPVGVAAAAAVLLALAALALAAPLGLKTLLALAVYAALNIAYSAGLRREPVLDVLIVSSGFVLRPVAGAYAIPVRISAWLWVVSLFLSLALALLKRRSEFLSLDAAAVNHRPALEGYSLRFLDQLISIATAAGIMSYALYTFQSEHGEALALTLPLFLYGVFRYLYLVYERGAGGSPEEVFLHDRGLQIDAVLYLAAVIAILLVKN
ncbi:MAG: decaprenyl-phosphate phosphoribosyltransferase [Acidobacteriia bacterium]|nr:decaprenyl-phosphate phosphoribosyltransferase [Terriglobia bacterium]